jgi:hypothetical protein
VTALEGWAEDLKLQLIDVAAEVKANTRLTEDIHGDTAALVEFAGDLKVFSRWGKRLGTFAKYATPVLLFFGAVWALITTGHWPK